MSIMRIPAAKNGIAENLAISFRIAFRGAKLLSYDTLGKIGGRELLA